MSTQQISVGSDTNSTHLVAFTVVTLAVSGAVAAVTISETVGNETTIPIMLTPALAAIVLRRLEGDSVRRTVAGSLRGTTARSIVFSVGFPIVFISVVAIIALTTTLGTYRAGIPSPLAGTPIDLYPVYFLIIGAITYGEELGWRGYLLPELTVRIGELRATAIVGIVWALYHLPALYFGAQATGLGDPVMSSAIQMGAVFAVAAFPVSYAYYLSNGSVIGPLVLHVTWNTLNPWVLGNVYTNVEGFIAGQVILISGEGFLGFVVGLVTLPIVALLIHRKVLFGTR